MKCESARLKTFRHWPYDYISPSDLAKAGFFYLQKNDTVQCAFCYGFIMNWKIGEHPYIRHVNTFPLCPFIMGRDVGNVSLGGDICGSRMSTHEVIHQMPPTSGPENGSAEVRDLGIHIHKGPYHPSQASKNTRLRTFLSWPQHATVKPEELAQAGFFYVGINDSVRCFYCNGGLTEWEMGDNPWVEHARWYPHCSFVILIKGHVFIQSILMKFQDLGSAASVCVQRNNPLDQTNNATTSHIQTSMNSDALTVHDDQSELNVERVYNIPRQVDQQVLPTHVNTLDQTVESMMNSNMIRAFLEMNSQPMYLVRLAILRHLETTGNMVQDIDELCEAIHKVEACNVSKLPQNGLAFGESEGQSSEVCLGGNRSLGENLICKICMDREIGVVFLPCAHLMSCIQCATALENCPICRIPIKRIIRTFIV